MPKKRRKGSKKESDKDLENLEESVESPKDQASQLEQTWPQKPIKTGVEDSGAVEKKTPVKDTTTDSETPSRSPASGKIATPILPSSYEIEYRTRVRFPVPEILAAAAEISKRVSALEADLASIKQLVMLIQEKIARGFDITESSSSIFDSDKATAGPEIKANKRTEQTSKEEELDDVFMTLL